MRVLQRQPRRHAQLFLHNVHARNQLGNGVFHLHARVHLNKEKLAVFIQEFKRARAAIANAFARRHASLADFFALRRRDKRRGGFFDNLLMTALHGTIALAQINRIAVFIRQHLNFHMAWALQKAFHVHHRVAKGRFRFGAGHFYGFEQIFFLFHHAHTAPTAATRCLDNHRETHLIRRFQDFVRVAGQRPVRPRHARHARFNHRFFGGYFVAHQADGIGAGANKHKARIFHLLGKIGVFRQKTIARVNRIRARNFRRRDDRWNVQIALRAGRRPDAHAFVCQLNVQAVFIGFGMHGNGGNAHLAAGAQYAQSNFASVGDKNFF